MKSLWIAGLMLAAGSLAAAELSFDGEIAARESAAMNHPSRSTMTP